MAARRSSRDRCTVELDGPARSPPLDFGGIGMPPRVFSLPVANAVGEAPRVFSRADRVASMSMEVGSGLAFWTEPAGGVPPKSFSMASLAEE
jgi:hypothetical protein